MADTQTVSDHFVNKDPVVRALYDQPEQISAKRFHHIVRISSTNDFEEELKTWIEEAYILSE